MKPVHPSNRRVLIWWAIGALLAGLLPIISSLLVELIAPQLGCLVIEHGAYTRGASYPHDNGDLSLGCFFSGVNVGPVLHAMHLFMFAILITWPLLIASVVLWAKLLVSRRRRITREM